MHDALWRSFFSCARVLNRSLSIGYTWERGHCTFPFFSPPNNHLAERKTKCLRWYPPPLLLIGKKMRRRHCPPHVTRDHATRGNEVQNTPEKKLTPSEKTHIFSRTANAKKKNYPDPLECVFFTSSCLPESIVYATFLEFSELLGLAAERAYLVQKNPFFIYFLILTQLSPLGPFLLHRGGWMRFFFLLFIPSFF